MKTVSARVLARLVIFPPANTCSVFILCRGPQVLIGGTCLLGHVACSLTAMDSLLDNGVGIRATLFRTHRPAIAGYHWIGTLSRLARSGYFQAALILLSLLWALFTARQRHRRDNVVLLVSKASKIPVGFELCSQLTRAVSLALITVGAARSQGQWLNVALVGYQFALGLSRLTGSPRWRHAALHQVNFLLVGALVVLATGELLPLLDLKSGYKADAMVLGATAALTAALAVALVTPREWLPPPQRSLPAEVARKLPALEPAVEEKSSWLSYYWTYGWLTHLVWTGSRQEVVMDDLPGLPWYDDPALMLNNAMEARQKSKSTLTTVLRFSQNEMVESAVWIALGNAAGFIAPFAMYQLLTYLGDPDGARLHPALWIFLLFAGPVSKSIFFQQYVFVGTRLMVRAKSGFTQELYHRALTSMELDDDILDSTAKDPKDKAQKATSAGRLANLMAGDIDSICSAKDIVMIVAGSPISAILSFVGLYKIMGWAAVVGVFLVLLTSPIPTWLAQLVGHVQRSLKLAQDSRISLVSEYLASIRAIKYFAWEEAMTKHISDARDREQRQIWRVSVLWVLIQQATGMMPIMALLTMFSLYVGVMKQPLTAATAFTTLSLIQLLRSSINQMGMLSKNAMSAWISLKRLDRYFEATAPLAEYPEGPLQVQDATFRRTPKADFRLRDVSISFLEGGLNAVGRPERQRQNDTAPVAARRDGAGEGLRHAAG